MMLSPQPAPQEPTPPFRFSPNPNRADEIAWREWSPEAFEQAEREKKPILLSISAVWCHWCHVMDETTYSDERVIARINERYIPIRVDADRRPDIQDRYLMGGWPTTAFLTSNGEVMTGGTYVPPDELARVLERVGDYYADNFGKLQAIAEEQRRNLIEAGARKAGAYRLDRSIVNEVLRSLQRSFDSEFGGFSEAPKFPNPPAIELLLRRAYLEDETYLLEMAVLTLDHMASGGLFDIVWGGFFRYSTEREWGEPHYEKMLADNAWMIVNYLHGYQVSDNLRYRDIAEKTLGYVDRFLARKDAGGFSGSQDADEEFYGLRAEERLKRRMPYIDPIIYVDANAQMVSAYIEAYRVLGGDSYRDYAVKTIDFLLATCRTPNDGIAHYYDGAPHLFGRLSDQAHMIGALLDAYNVTGNRDYTTRAKEILAFCERALLGENGVFFDIPERGGRETVGALVVRRQPLQENAVIARHMYRLAFIDGDARYEEMAERTLANIELGEAGPIPSVAFYGLAVDEILTEPVILTLIGTQNEPGAEALFKEAWKEYLPGKETKLLDPIKDYELIEGSGFPAERHPVLYPCIGRVCLPSVDTAHEFKAISEDLPGRPR